jgi:hypothetical protein
MKILFPLMLMFLVSTGPGCSSQRQALATDSPASSVYGTMTPDRQPGPQQGTAIKRNGANVIMLVESVSVAREDMFTLFVRLDSAVAIEGMDSPAVPGQWLTLSPGYILDAKGNIDRSIDRNKRLMSLQSARQGDLFRGMISFEGKNGWFLLDVEKR